jgi:hypothetical protein
MDTSRIIEGLRPLAVAIDQLVPDPDNARRHGRRNLDAIRESLVRYGQVKPIAARRADRVVLAGNGRLRVMRELGWDAAAVVWIDGTDEEMRAFAVIDNKTSDLAEWDELALAETLAALDDADVDLGAMGFSVAEIDALDLPEMTPEPEPQEHDDAPTPEPPARAEDPAHEGEPQATAGTRHPPRPGRSPAADAAPAVGSLTLDAGQLAALREAAEACRAWRCEPVLTDAEALVIIAERFTRARRREKE